MSVTGMVVALLGRVVGRSHAPEPMPRIPPPPRLPRFDDFDHFADGEDDTPSLREPRFGDTLRSPPPDFRRP